MDVSDSTTSKDENLTNKLLKDQWNNINWSEVEISINRLQSRITKAVIQNRWNLVKRLQYLLEHSYLDIVKLTHFCRYRNQFPPKFTPF